MSEPLPSLGDLSASEALRVEQACRRFERAWKDWRQRPRPDPAPGLGEAAGAVRAVLLCELLRLELVYRRQGGEAPTLPDYLPRFPREGALLRAVLAEEGAGDPSRSPFPTTIGDGGPRTRAALAPGMSVVP